MSFDKAYRMHNLIFYLFLTTIPHGINNLIKVLKGEKYDRKK